MRRPLVLVAFCADADFAHSLTNYGVLFSKDSLPNMVCENDTAPGATLDVLILLLS